MSAQDETLPSPTHAAAGEILRESGITPTQQRVEIAARLLGRPQHISAEGLLDSVRQAGAEVSKATVYNTLKLFADHGLLREVIVDPAKVFYDSNTRPHHHFYDTQSGELTDIPLDDVSIECLATAPSGRRISSVEVIVRLVDE